MRHLKLILHSVTADINHLSQHLLFNLTWDNLLRYVTAAISQILPGAIRKS